MKTQPVNRSNVQDCTQLRKLQKLRKIVKFVNPRKLGQNTRLKGTKDTAKFTKTAKNSEFRSPQINKSNNKSEGHCLKLRKLRKLQILRKMRKLQKLRKIVNFVVPT